MSQERRKKAEDDWKLQVGCFRVFCRNVKVPQVPQCAVWMLCLLRPVCESWAVRPLCAVVIYSGLS